MEKTPAFGMTRKRVPAYDAKAFSRVPAYDAKAFSRVAAERDARGGAYVNRRRAMESAAKPAAMPAAKTA